MKALWIGLAAASVLTGAAVAQAAPATPDPAALVFKAPDQIPWQGDKRFGSLIYVISGDPTKPGPYALLVKWLPNHMSTPHQHPNERRITVVSGTWWVGTGKTYSPDTTFPIPAGSVVTHFAKQWHYDGAKDGEVILEITGEGPQ
jgi:hypothetical protein